MKLKDYRKRAKELGGKITVKKHSFGKVAHVVVDGVEIGDMVSKQFYNAHAELVKLSLQMSLDTELKHEGYIA